MLVSTHRLLGACATQKAQRSSSAPPGIIIVMWMAWSLDEHFPDTKTKPVVFHDDYRGLCNRSTLQFRRSLPHTFFAKNDLARIGTKACFDANALHLVMKRAGLGHCPAHL